MITYVYYVHRTASPWKKVLKIRDPIIYPLHWWQICINTITILSSFGKCLNALTFPWRNWSIKTLVHSLNQMRRVTITNFLFWVNIPKLLQSSSFKDLQISKRLRTSTNLKIYIRISFLKTFRISCCLINLQKGKWV